jgi:hypothetical protein
MPKLIKPYQDFRGGWNADAAPDNLADNELMQADNADLDERGAISKRPGVKPLVNTSDTCPDQAGLTSTEIKLADSASAVDDYYNGMVVYISNGTGAGQVRTITDYVGLTKVATVDSAWDTQPDNTSVYEIYVKYASQVERLIEWPRNDGTKVLLAIVGTTLARIADDGTKTDLKTLDNAEIGYFFYQDKFYFTGKEAGVDEYWYYDGATVSAVTPNAATDNDLTPIKRCREFLWHPKSQRIFASKDPNDRAALYYSEPGDPTYFVNTSKLYPTTGDGPVYGLVLFGEAMLAVYQQSEWTWKGVDPAVDAEWTKLPSSHGTVASRSIALTPNSLTFLGQGGIISLSPGLVDYNIVLLTGDELVKNRAKDKVTSIIRSIVHPETACAVYDKINERYLLAYGDDSNDARNNKVLVLDWGLQTFTRYTGWQVNDFCLRANGDLLIATNNYILKAGQGYKDWDPANDTYKAIQFAVKTKQWNLDYPFHLKHLKRFFLAARQFDTEESSVDVSIKVDYKYYELTALELSSLSLDESFVWGESWGNPWGWSDLITKEAKVKGKGLRCQVGLTNNVIDEPVVIYGTAFEFRVRRPKGVKV